MAEGDALRPSSGSGRMENGGPRVLVEIREREVGRAERQQRFVFAVDREIRLRRLGAVVHQDVGLHRLQMVLELLHQRQEVSVEQNRRRAGVIDRIGDVLRRQADVNRLHDRAHHRDGEVALVIAVAIPLEDGDDVALLDADLGEPAREPPDAFAKLAEGPSPQIAIDDLLIRRAHHWGVQQMLDQQRICVGRRRRRHDLDWHDVPSVSYCCVLWPSSASRALTRIKNRRGNVEEAAVGVRPPVGVERRRRLRRSAGTAPMRREAGPAGPR